MLTLKNHRVDGYIQAFEFLKAELVLFLGVRMRQNRGLPSDRI